MNMKFAFLVAALGFGSCIFLGAVCFGDHFVTGCVALFFLFAYGIAWPLTFAYGRLVQRQKNELFRALVMEDSRIQDVLLAQLDENTRSEFLQRLGRNAA